MTRSEKKFRERMERQLSFNQGARIKDSLTKPSPLDENFDDERLDLNFVEQNVTVAPIEFAETEPEIYDEHDNALDMIANAVIAALKSKQTERFA